MIWILSIAIVYLLIQQGKYNERLRSTENELQKVRNTFKLLADERQLAAKVKTDKEAEIQTPLDQSPIEPVSVSATESQPTPAKSVQTERAQSEDVNLAWKAERERVAKSSKPIDNSEPSAFERIINAAKRWLTEGNVPVKVGVVVTFFGIAALLRFIYIQGYFTFPIEYRLIMIAVAALAALAFGWRVREQNPAFGLSLQGGAIGTLMLTIFATYKYFNLLPASLSFVLIVVLVAGAALLAVLQNSMWIAVLGFLGGYLAPVLISTGSGNHITLFSYYALLNTAVFAIAWKKSWRVLNLMGFVFTFGVGTAWGAQYYKPELFNTVEPFLILFFMFYIIIGLMYVIKQTEYRKPWVDGTLVFGTPLLAFPLQAVLLEDNRLGLAFSALAVSMIYVGLVYFLHRRKNERLLAEAYGALAIGFATLAVPLAFSAATTATVWALEGVGITWIGLRQKRRIPILSGVLLQLLAAGCYLISISNSVFSSSNLERLVLNPIYLGAFIIAISGFMLSLILKRLSTYKTMPTVLFVWASLWWFAGMIHEFDIAKRGIGIWQYATLFFSITIFAAALLKSRLRWFAMQKLAAFTLLSAPLLVLVATEQFDAPLMMPSWGYWAAFAIAGIFALWQEANDEDAKVSRIGGFMHIVLLWSVALALSLQWHYHVNYQWDLSQGWYAPAICIPIVLITIGLWRMNNIFAWPMHNRFHSYETAWFSPVFVLLAGAWMIGLFLEGSSSPVMYLPIINPLELSMLAVAVLFVAYIRDEKIAVHSLNKILPYVGFVFITMATLRGVHHLHGEPWNASILSSGFTQASLTIVWSLLGVSGLILGSRRGDRKQWMAGGLLMLFVLGKLILIDRTYMSNIPGIVSCLAVGLLLVVVGYFSPQPPKEKEVT
jgi:uncharacterized membrane protein